MSWNGTPPAATGKEERDAAIQYVERRRSQILRRIPGLVLTDEALRCELAAVDGILQALRFGDHIDEATDTSRTGETT